jgi:hypothetical protein
MVNLFHRNPKQMTELEASISNGVTQIMAGRQSSDEEQRRSLAEDFLMLKDPHIENMLTGMSKYSFTDEKGVLGEAGKEYSGVYAKNIALAVSQSSLIRTGWISEKQSRIMLLENASLYLRRIMLMTEEEYEEGGELLMDSLRKLDDMNVLCAINGRLSKLVKSHPHNIDVNVGTKPNGKGGDIG